VESIESYFIGRRVAIMSGVLRDKDYRAIAKTVGRVADVVYTITPDNPRALSAEEYAKVLQDVGVAAFATNGISDALTKGMAYADEHNCPLCCLGSLYTYSSVIDELEKTK
jgi:dihydrofolate synthase/folylpolyglutamate synthase